MAHLMLLVFVLALAVGAASVALLALMPRRRGRSGDLLSHALPWWPTAVWQLGFFNLILFVNLPYLYYGLNLEAGADVSSRPAVDLAYHAISVILKLLWAFLYVRLTQRFLKRDLPPWALRVSRTAGPVLLALWLAAVVHGLLRSDPLFCARVHHAVEILVIVAVGGATLLLILRIRHQAEDADRPVLRRLAIALMTIWLLITLSLAAPHAGLPISPETSLCFNSLLILGYNVVFLIALRSRLRIALDSPSGPGGSAEAWERLMRTHDLSAREQEVARLVCQGRRNQEIADTLFISLQTVKDHNYRVYRKLGVRNRVELVNLLRGLGS
jgi:DNA-binding CsgD family transcriptional regulator